VTIVARRVYSALAGLAGGGSRAVAAENLATSDYDAYADEFAVSVAWRERAEADGDAYGILPGLLDLLGDVGGCRVLDAGCGDVSRQSAGGPRSWVPRAAVT